MIKALIAKIQGGSERSATIKKNIFWSLIIKGISILVSLMLVPMTLGYVSVEIYGVWLTISSILHWLTYMDVGFTLGLKNRLAEALAKEEEERQQQEQRRMLMIAGGIIALILIIVIIIVIKRRRNRAYAEEFSGVPFAGINDEDEYDNYDDDNQSDNYNAEPLNGQDDFSQKEDNDDLQIEENNQELRTKLDFDDSKEKEEKEKAKRDFLEGYNSDYTDEYEEDRPRRGRRKGKRFK